MLNKYTLGGGDLLDSGRSSLTGFCPSSSPPSQGTTRLPRRASAHRKEMVLISHQRRTD